MVQKTWGKPPNRQSFKLGVTEAYLTSLIYLLFIIISIIFAGEGEKKKKKKMQENNQKIGDRWDRYNQFPVFDIYWWYPNT